MRAKIDKIFVYGTLMGIFSNQYARLLQEEASLIGTATIPGHLFDLGLYPGALYDEKSKNKIHGEVYEFAGNKIVLELDFYEGNWEKLKTPNEFIRKSIPVFFDNDWTDCWFYQYNLDYRSYPLIKSGNYAQYLKGKKVMKD
jgi:gamma-glutamylcyclotransferase (GGCT)/AIG2-like uncharacterized protein YtfP